MTRSTAAYRVDGRARPAYDPAMMVALLLYAYARGTRSSRVIERACSEDVAFRVIAAQQRPDHATIARFLERHQQALAGLFGEVLTLCASSGLAQVGVLAVDGTKVQANASRNENLDYERLAREIVEEAIATDAAEDELYGDRRGDELPPEFSTSAGRRGWLREAKKRLEAERSANPQPVPRDRPKRVKQAKRRLDEELWTEVRANRAYEAWRARGIAADGSRRMAPGTIKPFTPPRDPGGPDQLTDPDSKVVKGLRGWIQGYNAQAVTNEHQIVLAAEIATVGADFGHLEPMLDAAQHELHAAGVDETPGVLLADAGYWHGEQMQRIVDRGIQVLIPPDTSRKTHDHASQLGRRPLRRDARAAGQRARRRALPQTPADDRAGVRANEVQPRPRQIQTPRPRRGPHRMAADHRHPQPPQAPPPHHRGRLKPRRPADATAPPRPQRHRRGARPRTYATAKPACATQPYRCVSAPSAIGAGRLRRVRRCFAMNGALCEPLATGFLAGDLDEDRRRGSRGFPAAGRGEPSDLQRAVDGNHRRAAGVDGVDDLGVVDALEVDRGDAEVGVAELALDDDQRHALAGHLDGVRVAQLVRREASPHAGLAGDAAQLASARRRPPTAARAWRR